MSTTSEPRPPILDLPQELLASVAMFILDVSAPLRGHDSSLWDAAARSLRHMALTCSGFRRPAQEALVRRIYRVCCSRTYALAARTLVERPDLAVRVNKMVIDISSHEDPCAEHPDTDFEVRRSFKTLILSTRFPDHRKKAWIHVMRRHQAEGLTGVLLTLVPNLKYLEIMNPSEWETTPGIIEGISSLREEPLLYPFGGILFSRSVSIAQRNVLQMQDMRALTSVPGFTNLTRLRLNVYQCLNLHGLRHLQKLKVLDIAFQPDHNRDIERLRGFLHYEQADLENIQHLRLDSRIWIIRFRQTQWFQFLGELIPAMTGLVRIGFYDEPLYYDWTEENDFRPERYHSFLQVLRPVRASLQILELPGGFWSLSMRSRALPIKLQGFEQLKELTTPAAALIGAPSFGKPHWADWEWDNWYEPHSDATNRLPKKLQILKIFEVNDYTCQWLWLHFSGNKPGLEHLTTVELVAVDDKLDRSFRLRRLVEQVASYNRRNRVRGFNEVQLVFRKEIEPNAQTP
jgi:hypothetical protein